MKKFLSIVFTVVLSVILAFPVGAEQSDCSLTLPDNFVSAARGEDLTELAKIFDMTAENLQEYYQKNDVLYIAKQLAGEGFTNRGIVHGEDGNPYIQLEQKLNESGGEYLVTEYITVCSSKLFALKISVYQTEKTATTAQTVFKGLAINDTAHPSDGGSGLLYTVLAAGGIAVFAALAVYLTYTVIRDMRKVREDNE